MKAYHNKWLMANKPKLKQRLHEYFCQAPTESGTDYISRCQTVLLEYLKAGSVYDISTELVSDLVAGTLPTYLPLKQQHCSVLAYADVGSLMAAMVGIAEANKDSDQLFVGFANHDKPKQQVTMVAEAPDTKGTRMYQDLEMSPPGTVRYVEQKDIGQKNAPEKPNPPQSTFLPTRTHTPSEPTVRSLRTPRCLCMLLHLLNILPKNHFRQQQMMNSYLTLD
jgi:hypothetical protein